MSNREMNAFLEAGLPPGIKLTGLQGLLYLIICHRYDTRPFVNGEPNKGYLKSYPGMDLFLRVTGKARSSIETALGVLKALGLITQVQKGYTRSRANYVPTYSINLLNKSVGLDNTLETRELDIPAERVRHTGVESDEYRRRELGIPVTISIVSNINTNKCDLLRFNSFISEPLPERLRPLIKPGKNLEALLDECDELGITNDVRRLIAENTWDNVIGSPGGIVIKIIKEALERKRSGQAVIAPVQKTYQPPKYVLESRVKEPPSEKSQAIIDAAKEIMRSTLDQFGRMPD